MIVNYISVSINMNVRRVVSRDVMPHEIPIIRSKFGDGSVVLKDRQVSATREIDDIYSEFNRCVGAWGATSNEKDAISYAEKLYGAGEIGAQMMESQMSRGIESLFEGQPSPLKETAKTNDEATAKLIERNAPSASSELKVPEMRDAMESLGIDVPEELKGKKVIEYGKSKLTSMAENQGHSTVGLSTVDLLDLVSNG